MTTLEMMEQLAHVGWGALIFDALGARLPLKWALIIVVAFALVKEVLLESVFAVLGPRQPWPKCFEDLAFWAIGIGLGLFIWRFDL